MAPARRAERHDALRAAVLGWYRANGRPLAFRGTTDPWAILVSEFMAQQTQAARAAEAWRGFLERFPTPAALATASPADALRAWRGLGYNRRAISLRSAAIRIVEDHGGRVPSDIASLDALPGVGPYTARAVAALAFGARVGAVDTNVRRVLSRALFDGAPGARELQAVADGLVPGEGPGEWTHALMDVGATFCRPRNPRCDACPARAWCRYAAVRREAGVPGAVVATGAVARVRPPAPVRPPARVRPPAGAPFAATSRWLRGRILDALRDAPVDAWTRFDRPIGAHEPAAILIELERLASDGLVERDPGAADRARLPIA